MADQYRPGKTKQRFGTATVKVALIFGVEALPIARGLP
jgi:hypothetical protein